MQTVLGVFNRPIVVLVVASLALDVANGLYLTTVKVPSPAVQFLQRMIWSFVVFAWLQQDSRRAGGIPCFDFGFSFWLTLPLSLGYYAFWSRGWRGLALLALMVGLWLIP